MKLFRGRIFTPTGNPFEDSRAWTAFEDGFLAVEDGRIAAIGPWSSRPEASELVEFGSAALLVPGFVDLHLHAPQLEMIGSFGGQLLEWLERYTFPNEAKFADPKHAERVARLFYDELYRHGTLTALVFSTTHTSATETFFREAERVRFRAILGKTMMDRNAPPELLEDPETAHRESRGLIERWNGRGRLGYAITPRFAPTSSPRLLELAGALHAEFPETWVHTHLSESAIEIEWVRRLFPDARDYAAIYDRYGLLGERSVLAHAIHLDDEERALVASRGSRVAHCPNSNLFLGSGLFPMQQMLESGIAFGLGSDVGAGTALSMFSVMADAYKVQQVRGLVLTPVQLWYLGTLAGARALHLDAETGSLEPGKAADFLVLDLEATPLLEARTRTSQSFEEILAALIFLGDDRAVLECRVEGDLLRSRDLSIPGRPGGATFARVNRRRSAEGGSQ
ncbi:MAG TPA: guanine deaminase [Thermoanaerobaculia bacterium]|nr:guanine deaminase [Thermoanaerobaculia bacterium]